MQYKIPQNVDVEDKIIGPLTLRQFVVLLIAGFVCFALYSTVGRTSLLLFVAAGAPFACAGLAFAFLRINERSMETFILAAGTSIFRPRRRVWRQVPDLRPLREAPPAPVRPEEYRPPSADEIHSQLEQLATVVDTRGWGRPDEATEEFLSHGRIVSPDSGGTEGWHDVAPDMIEEDEHSKNPIAKLLDDVLPDKVHPHRPAAPAAAPSKTAPPVLDGLSKRNEPVAAANVHPKGSI